MINNVSEILLPKQGEALKRPYFSVSVSAGFPSPADDHLDRHLDLNDYLIKHPAATFFVRVSGDSMINAGIHNGDILIVDRAINAEHQHVVVAVVNGDFTVKRLHKEKNKLILLPENKNYEPITVTDGMECEIWGVVTNVIHSLV